MVEVFKTNVNNYQHAYMLIDRIHKTFAQCKANFDLEDCDNILRVKSFGAKIQPTVLIRLLKEYGFHAEVLQDDNPRNHDALDQYASAYFTSSYN